VTTDNGPFARWWVEQLHWFIFPVHGVTDDLRCTCGNIECKHIGKHPYTPLAPNGHNSASNNPAQVAAWWAQAPFVNIGVDCGRSNLVVLDCDGDDGTTNLFNWCAGFGLDELPDTLHQRTGGGGEQFFYDAGEYKIKSMNGYQPSNDIKAQGGYVVLPSSLHKSGNRYELLGEPKQPTPIPEILAQRLMQAKSGAAYESKRAPGAPSTVFREAKIYGAQAGYRDEFFNSLAFELKKLNYEPETAVAETKRIWELTEQPPGNNFPLDEALRKLRRVYEDQTVEADAAIVDWPAGMELPSRDVEGPEAPVDDLAGTGTLTDVGNGRRLAEYTNGEWVWTPELEWCKWQDGVWARDKNHEISEVAKNTIRIMQTRALTLMEDEKQATIKWAFQSNARGKIDNMIYMAQSDPRISRHITDFDTNPAILTTANCTVDLKTGISYESRREDLCMKRTHVPFTQDFKDERFNQYMRGTFNGDEELISYIQRVVGSMMFGVSREKSLYIAYGPKNTGKTTFMNILQTMMGDYSMFIMPENLMSNNRFGGGTPQHEIARMYGMRIVVSDEPPGNGHLAESSLKLLTGGDTLSGCYKYQNPFQFTPSHSLFLATNHVPSTNDKALQDRVVIVPFYRELKPWEQNTSLGAEVNDPTSTFMQAALSFFVSGCVEYHQKQGIDPIPSVVELITATWKDQQDIIGQFISDNLEEIPKEYVKMIDVYTKYQQWMTSVGEHPWTQRALTKDLEERGMATTRDTHKGRLLWGWKIKESSLTWPGLSV
jgi:putative DNA primase/helicase